MRYLFSLIGIVAALVFMAVSAYFNFRYGVSKYGGGVAFDGYAVGALAVAADVSKAVAPLFVAWFWAARKPVLAGLGIVWIGVCIVFSLMSSSGFITEKRDSYAADRAATSGTYASVRKQLRDARQRLEVLGASRPVATIEAELASQRTNRRWSSSKQCTNATATRSRAFCATYNTSLGQLAKAKTIATERARVQRLVQEANRLRGAGGLKQVDPQLAFFEQFGIHAGTMDLALVIAMVMMLEFGSAFLLVLSWPHERRQSRSAPSATTTLTTADREPEIVSATRVATPRDTSRRIAHEQSVVAEETAQPHNDEHDDGADVVAAQTVAAYSVSRLVPAPDEAVSLSRVYSDYRDWAQGQGEKPLSRPAFYAAVAMVAGEVEAIEVVQMGRTKVLRHVAFKPAALAA